MTQLSGMPTSALRKLARGEGISDDDLHDAADSGDEHRAVIELILVHRSAQGKGAYRD